MARTLRGKDPKHVPPSKPKILIFGKPGVGKTWASLDFPSVYYIDSEGGADLDHYTDKLKASGGAYFGPRDGGNDFDAVLEEIITLTTVPHNYRTLVIDSYSKLFNTRVDIEFETMQKAGRDMTKTFGAEKKPAINYTRKMVRWFEKLDMNVILICHEKDKWENGAVTGQTYDGWDKLEYELHLAMHIMKQGKSRKAKVMKTRLLPFPDGTLFDWSYAEFAERFGRDVIEAAAVTVNPASDEQIRTVKGLEQIVRIGDETKEKWFEKAGVSRWDDMAADTIQACIDHLTKQIPTQAAVS